MKYIFFFLMITGIHMHVTAQKSKPVYGPVFKEFGQVYQVENADLLLDIDKGIKVIFDVYTDEKKSSIMNPLLNTVARFINMHARYGLTVEQMDIVVVLHGAATKNALTEKAFKKEFKNKNPNYELLHALQEQGVRTYVCGQSLISKGYQEKDVSESVGVSLSALTALVKFQSEGYQLINFN